MTYAVVDAASATALAAVMPQGASRGARAARRAEAFALALKAGVLAQLRASGHADVATELERDVEWLLMCLPGYFESLRAAGDAVEHIVVLVSKCAYGQKLAMIDRPYRDRLEALNMASGRKTIWLDFASNVLFCMAAKASAALNADAGGPCHSTPVADMRAFGYVLSKLMAIINSVVPVEQVINTSRNASIELLQREMQRAGLPNELRTNVKQGLHWHRFNAAKFDAQSVAVAFGVLLRVVPRLLARGVDLGLFRQAAEQGRSEAQSAIGFAYYNGRGVPVDFERAAHYWRLGAKGGNIIAMFNLGECYRDGVGVKRSLHAARKWLLRAKEAGYDDADDASTLDAMIADLDARIAVIEAANAAAAAADAAKAAIALEAACVAADRVAAELIAVEEAEKAAAAAAKAGKGKGKGKKGKEGGGGAKGAAAAAK